MQAEELQRRIAQFSRWHYRFEFEGGVATPIYREDHVNRHEQRRRYFFDALLAVTGGSLAGMRVLDLGCNAGFWSLAAAEAGADFVLGVDGRGEHVEQAQLVFEAKGVDRTRYRFERANIFEHSFAERFDVVLCLGLMYHVSQPVKLFEIFTSVGASLVVIDTEIHPSNASCFALHHVSLENPMTAVDYTIVLYPSRQAVLDLAGEFDFTTVPLKPNMSNYEGMAHYRDRRRLAFICSKGPPLDMLHAETRRPVTPVALKVGARLRRPLRPLRRALGRADKQPA
jgi:tRNA (mo5U34)-methyltransferase